MKCGFVTLALGALVVGFCAPAGGDSLIFHFRVSAEGGSSAVMPDVFRAVGSQAVGVQAGYDPADLLKPPGPPKGNYVRAKTVDTGRDLIGDYRPFDPNTANLNFPIELSAHDDAGTGLDGTVHLTLTNPDQLDDVPSDMMVYLKRYDSSGKFAGKYDLRESSNNSIQWSVQAVQGHFATVNFVLVNKCIAADLDGSGVVNLSDLAKLANSWSSGGEDGDVDGNNDVDFADLIFMADYWLCTCSEKQG